MSDSKSTEQLSEEVNRLVGMAVLKNDKNYAWDILELFDQELAKHVEEARIDEIERFVQSSDLAGISNFNGNGLAAAKRRIAELTTLNNQTTNKETK